MSDEAKADKALYDEAEEGWKQMIEAAEKLQDVANRIKKTDRSIDGYNIERALIKHKPDLMKIHLEGLQDHRQENEI